MAAVLAGIEAARKYGYHGVSGAPTGDSITAIKDVALATSKALAPSAADAALAAIIDTISSSILLGLTQPGNAPTDVVVATINDAVSNSVTEVAIPGVPAANVGYAVSSLPVNSPPHLNLGPNHSSSVVYN